MSKTAYLVGALDVKTTPPTFLGVSIFSEPSPTSEFWTFVVTQSNSDTYEEAEDDLRAQLECYSVFDWTRSLLSSKAVKVAEADIEDGDDCPFMMQCDGWWCTHPSRKRAHASRSGDDLWCALISAPNGGCPLRENPLVRFRVTVPDIEPRLEGKATSEPQTISSPTSPCDQQETTARLNSCLDSWVRRHRQICHLLGLERASSGRDVVDRLTKQNEDFDDALASEKSLLEQLKASEHALANARAGWDELREGISSVRTLLLLSRDATSKLWDAVFRPFDQAIECLDGYELESLNMTEGDES